MKGLRHRLGTVRARTTIAAVLVVGVALAAAGITLVFAMRHSLTDDVGDAARLRATDVATLIESRLPSELSIGDGESEDQLVQVIDRRGEVVVASANVAGIPPVASLRPGDTDTIRVPIDDDRFLAVAVEADTDAGPVTVIVARTLETVHESTQAVVRLLVVGLPLLLVIVVVTTWTLLGRTLAPVEAMRSEVEAISAAELHRRVPDPPGSDEVARLASTMNRMLERLEQAQLRQRQFVSDASHELKSPVASIRQHAEVALAHPQRDTIENLAATVLAEAHRLQQLTDDLLLLARVDEHTLHLHPHAVDLDDIVFDEAERCRGRAGLLVDTTAVSAGRVLGDAAALRRVVGNLADNAARHAHRRVQFSLAQVNGRVVLGVEDDGPGIAPGDRRRVFERFVRLDEGRARDDGGAGLGLAIVAEIVAAHGGSVTVGEAASGGARVEVTFFSEGSAPS